MKLQRYSTCNYSEFDTAEDGEWMKASDGKALEKICAEKSSEIFRLRGEKLGLKKEIEKLEKELLKERHHSLTLQYELDTQCGFSDKLEKRIEELELQLAIGTEDGSRCNRPCEGVMALATPENCSCHLSPPCAACENNRPVCSLCGEEVE